MKRIVGGTTAAGALGLGRVLASSASSSDTSSTPPSYVDPDAPTTAYPALPEDPSLNSNASAPGALDSGIAEPLATLAANRNILLIMVDQLRTAKYMTQAQLADYVSNVIPNIAGLRQRAVAFPNFYVNSAPCTPSRSCLLTGLYTHQTYMMVNKTGAIAPSMNPGFPTFAKALKHFNPAYQRATWIGKWHLSVIDAGLFEPNYGFKLRNIPDGGRYKSPDGWANEGANGDNLGPPDFVAEYASDQAIFEDFNAWFNSDRPGIIGPWLTAVSFINPHDIALYRDWFTRYNCKHDEYPAVPSFPPENWPGNVLCGDPAAQQPVYLVPNTVLIQPSPETCPGPATILRK